MNLNSFYKNRNVLVTGGAGFIGSHLVEALIKLDANVTVLDNLSTGKIENLKNLGNKINFIEADIRDFNSCLNTCINIKTIFHLAAMVSVPESVENPIKCNEINVTGILNLLECAKQNNVQQFVFSSSSAVYGEQDKILSEENNCYPNSPYGLSKLIGEQYCKLYSKEVPSICLRYFNVFGKRQDTNSAYAAVVAKFSEQMQNNLPITIFGDGKQTRDFISVEHVAQANLKLATLEKKHFNGQPINIANGNSITLLELIETLKKKFPKYKNQIFFKPARFGDIKNSYANINKLKSLINI